MEGEYQSDLPASAVSFCFKLLQLKLYNMPSFEIAYPEPHQGHQQMPIIN